ncbi:Protein of unknown function [Pyronema omphalodes CBS 100304]|uniref:Uncharacterized protein n=1 Tax=Pyronema omphalodes (strain CBS 100304) TaxID=1076935 RepID=U4L7C1_PYROM|nr:Protein of unknown function [Pyronema omphalodes CBS 100304]
MVVGGRSRALAALG